MTNIPHAPLTLPVILLALATIPGCGTVGRITTFPVDAAPAATASQTTVRITEAVRRPGELELALTIANPTTEPVIFARNYGMFTAATVVHGEVRITGERTPRKPRTIPPRQYTVLAGERTSLRLVFQAPDIDRAKNVTLHLAGSTHGTELVWTLPIPPEPSRPVAMASNP